MRAGDRQGGTLTARRSRRIAGRVRVPGDKSLSHRALMLAASGTGRSTIRGLLESADVLATAAALMAMGCPLRRTAPGRWQVDGRGTGGLAAPAQAIDCGNSGTTARLLAGLVASQPITAVLVGDASLSRRPMDRIIRPLSHFGARFLARAGRHLPMTVTGTGTPLPVTWRLDVPSAQLKSAILLAALNTPGRTTVIEPVATRDHTERMLAGLGAPLALGEDEDAARVITVDGPVELPPLEMTIPGDPSSAAFPLAAALLAEDGEVVLENVLVNPTRTGLLRTLAEMGAPVARRGEREEGGEPVADLVVRAMGPGALAAVSPPPERAPAMIDEYPILFVLAATARGRSVFRGIGELRAKESDRIRAVAEPLAAMGVVVEEGEDRLEITGCGGPLAGGITVDARGDHRIAMAFAVAGLAARAPIRITGAEAIATSFPDFVPLMRSLGADIASASG
ncbi:MAG: 3-phosphoshikimate 1-carboxyvinyltransferase [Rhodothalassiaceae bacterium]|nr:MAG: 3-phosphoshikimate 1-carboxyvinyltransferase [Rhodothalassiaceae bacterium]